MLSKIYNKIIVRLINLLNEFKHPFIIDENKFYRRKYKNNKDYLNHQRIKLSKIAPQLESTFQDRKKEFYVKFEKSITNSAGKNILCLGARDGAEVAALREMKMVAIGIDIAYPVNNPFVHYGDFHNIPYSDNCLDYVYMNVFDHVKEPEKVLKEIYRVLKVEGGCLIIDLVKGTEEGVNAKQEYESFFWKYQKQVVELIQDNKFKLIKECSLSNSWDQFIFEPIKL